MNFGKDIEHEKLVEVGMILRNRRVEMQLSAIDLSIELNLNYNYVKLIENGKISVDDNIFYLGYISSICKFLNLNDREILSYLNSTFQAAQAPKLNTDEISSGSNNLYFQLKKNNQETGFRYKFELLITVIVILIIILIYKIF